MILPILVFDERSHVKNTYGKTFILAYFMFPHLVCIHFENASRQNKKDKKKIKKHSKMEKD